MSQDLKLRLHGTAQARRLRWSPPPGEGGDVAGLLRAVTERSAPLQLPPGLEYDEDDSGGAVTVAWGAELSEALERHARREGSAAVIKAFPGTRPEPADDASGFVWLGPEDICGARECSLGGQGSGRVHYVDELRFWINGAEHRIRNPNPSTLLVDYLHSVGLTGTKVGCGEGGCGCCTVTLSSIGRDGSATKVEPVNSCLCLLCAVDGCVITTTEGLGSKKGGFHPIQEAIADNNGTQCGYCTPGWVMSMYSLMESQPGAPSKADVERHFDGNLCRCTGYRAILDGLKSLAAPGDIGARSHGLASCRHGGNAAVQDIEDCGSKPICSADGLPCQKYRRAAPLPRSVADYQLAPKKPLHFIDPATGQEWYRPTSLASLVSLRSQMLAENRVHRLVCGNTAMGVEKYYAGSPRDVYMWDAGFRAGNLTFAVTVDIKDIPELCGIRRLGSNGLAAGASVSISELAKALEANAAQEPPVADRPMHPYHVLAKHLRRVANNQVRNQGSWAGNLALARRKPAFPSDIATILAAAGATVQLCDDAGTLSMHPVEDFMSGDAGREGALLVMMQVPSMEPKEGCRTIFSTFKTSTRHVNAAAIVNAGFCLAVASDTGRVASARVFFNGLADHLFCASATEKVLVGADLSEATLKAAVAALEDDLASAGGPSTDPRHSPEYRRALARSYIYKTFLQGQAVLPVALQSVLVPFVAADDRPTSKGSQVFNRGDPSLLPVSAAVPKLTGRSQASGEASYASTMPAPTGQLHGCLVYATKAAAKLLAIDPSDALVAPGVVDFVAAADIPGTNALSYPHEPVFFPAGANVPAVGVAVGMVVARSARQARAAAKAVRLVYEEPGTARAAGELDVHHQHLRPVPTRVVSGLEEARRQGTIVDAEDAGAALKQLVAKGGHIRRGLREVLEDPEPLVLARGDPAGTIAVRKAEGGQGTISASVSTGAQKHFYMETQASVAIPMEDGSLELWSSTQDPSLTQEVVAEVLGAAHHSITVKVRRVGGGFGGKLSRHLPVAAACSVAAVKLGVPVRAQNERLDDLVMTGGRQEISAEYSAAFSEDGTVEALEMDLYCNVGWYIGDSSGDLAMAVAFSDNAYHTKDFSCRALPLTANLHTMTSMRAPGVVQSILAHEVVMEHVARVVGLPMDEVQERNFYKPGQKTPEGAVIGSATHNWTIPEMWAGMKRKVDFEKRKRAVSSFNAQNRWRKRGIAMTPVRYGIGTGGFKSGALVNIYMDGTVLLAHGGCELGQGINTKAAQVAAHTLEVPLSSIKVSDTDTSKVPFNTCTGGSMTSECTAKAVEDACISLKAKLAPYRAGGSSFEDAVAKAMKDGAILSAAGSWTNPVHGTEYSTCGVACTEAEVDVLSGEVQILSTNIMMDLGTALNPAVDIGQLEGGFVMALGYVLTEEVLFDEEGQPLNIGTWNYKIPSAHDIPLELNVELLDRPNPSGVFKSKASAEPPLSLVASVYFAVKEAIYAARAHVGETGWFDLQLPITVQEIQTACLVDPSQYVLA